MSLVSDATSTAPPAAGPPAWAIGAAYTRYGRPATVMSSNPGEPLTRARVSSRSSGSSCAPSVSERARIRPRESTT